MAISVLVVGGGGGAGNAYEGISVVSYGGGGGGGVTENDNVAIQSGTSYIVTVGAAGPSGPHGGFNGDGGQGGESIFYSALVSMTAAGGSGSTIFEAAGSGNGNPGGGCINSASGGGGGAGAAGANGSGNIGGNGGIGLQSSLSGAAVYYGGGGGGGGVSGGGSGGTGGGGNGSSGTGANGSTNTGGGGGAGGENNGNGGTGGSGIVIISAPTGTLLNPSTAASGGTYSTSGGNDIWTFLASGTWTPQLAVETFVVTDTTPVTDTPQVVIPILLIKVSDSTAVMDVVVRIDNNGLPSDIYSTLVSSSYKWLTSTLLAAQQSFAVRPYITCHIVDDTIQPNAQLFNGTGNPLGRGQMVTAPDGAVLAAGFDGSGHVSFWKAPDLNAVAGVWPTQVTLDTGSTLNQSKNQVSMSVSGWFAGSYQIDVWYFSNFGSDGSNLKIINQYSTDGGATWMMRTFNPAAMPNTAYNSGDFLSIAAMQDINLSGQVQSGCFYTKPNSNTFASGFTGYDVFYIYGNFGGFVTDVMWAANNANSADWTIQGLAAFYLSGTQYLAFSGIRNILGAQGQNGIENFSIWVTSILNVQGAIGSDLWSLPVAVMPIGSTNALNENQFVNPTANVVNGMAYIVMESIQVDSVSQTAQGTSSNVVQTHTNYLLIQSDDGKTFSYPSVMVYTDGTEFDSGTTASFVRQGGYWYLGGSGGYLWQFVQNEIVADVSNDVIGYSITEQAGQPSSINMQIANANNKWVGNAPTGQGAAAIAGNRKIVLWQGYYNALGAPESVPRNVYYIDDIQQQVNGNTNDFVLVGRDIYKNMIVTVTKYNYQFVGPVFYTDIFDGTTNGNWNQIAGTWTFSPTQNAVLGLEVGSEAVMMLGNVQLATFGHSMRVFFLNTETGTVIVYGMYVDSNNWLRLEIDTLHNTWAVKSRVGGSTGTIDSGSLPASMTNLDNYMVLVKRYGYWNFNFIFAYGGGSGNELTVYAPTAQSYLFANSGTGVYSMQSLVESTVSLQGAFSVGIGASASETQLFRYFQLAVYNNSNNVGEVTRAFARLSAIFSFKIVNTFRELFFTTTQINGAFTASNRLLSVEASNTAISGINSMGDGEIQFQARISLSTPATPGGFRFVFRSDSPTAPANAYYFHLLWNGLTGGSSAVTCRFERLFSGVVYQFYNSAEDVSYNPSFTNTCTLNIDPTIFHTYRVVAINGQMFAFVDNVMVAAWNDDNINQAYLRSGYWGFSADVNSLLQAQEVTAPILWKPVPATAINPGDEVESDITSLAESLLFWFFSDLFGRFKTIFLNATDPSTYTYDVQLYQQNVDQSDKEYVSQVTVYGSGVSATARNTSLMAGVPVRDIVIVENTILTAADAQTLANNTLINSNQYLNQNESTQVINVGAELFDVVTVVNQGNNTSGVNGPTRVYDQTFTDGGGNNNSDYSIKIDTGNV